MATQTKVTPVFSIIAAGIGNDVRSSKKYPSLQVDKYRGVDAGQEVNLVMLEDDLGLITPDTEKKLQLKPITVKYGHKPSDPTTDVLALTKDVRFFVVKRPNTFVLDSNGKISSIKKGMDFRRDKLRSVARVWLAASVNDELLLAADGTPQLFTMKLQSTRCKLISDYRSTETVSFEKVNTDKCKEFKLQNTWVLAVVPLQIVAVGEYFENADGDGSTGIDYRIVEVGNPVNQDDQAKLFAVANNAEFVTEFNKFGKDKDEADASDNATAPKDEQLQAIRPVPIVREADDVVTEEKLPF